MDDSGNHLAYLACVTQPSLVKMKMLAAPSSCMMASGIRRYLFPGMTLLFMSPSGKLALPYSLDIESSKFYLDKTVARKNERSSRCQSGLRMNQSLHLSQPEITVSSFCRCRWENAYRTRSEHIAGHVGWTADGKYVEFIGINNGRVVKVKQSL